MPGPLATLGVIGDPVAHSISPDLHNPVLAALGLREQYVRWHTPADELAGRVAALREPPMRGANVTLPHKIAVLPLLDRLDASAASLRACNTIVRERDGGLAGHNTDAPALRDSLQALGVGPGASALLLGAGGAARAALWALGELGVGQVTIVNRSPERALALGAAARCLAADDPALPAAAAGASLLINATALGWRADDPAPLDPALIHPGLLVYDMVYRPTALLAAAGRAGARACDGLDMLVRQAALAFGLWFGIAPPLEAMRAAAASRLAHSSPR